MDELKRLNFNKIIEFDVNPDKYSFSEYHKNGDLHPKVLSYCTQCEDNLNYISKVDGYNLCNISHGSHTDDFIEASNTAVDTTDWNEAGVMFIMENPSNDYGIYEAADIEKNGEKYVKRPAKQWYWIHCKQDLKEFPENFVGRKYGELIASIIVTFKLKNAYMTNLVKCGLNGPDGVGYKGTNEYNPECIRTCYEKILKKEIEFVEPKVIFAFGRNTYDRLCELTTGIKIVMLPHPARAQNGFTNEFYQTLYFGLITKWLYRQGVINETYYVELMRKYADVQ